MITAKDQERLVVALTSESVADEVSARIVGDSVTSPAEAVTALAIISDSKKEQAQIKEYMTIALTSDAAGSEMADTMNLWIEILGYQAADLVANNTALNAAQAKLKAMSEDTKERMVIALTDRDVADRINAEINKTTVAMQTVIDATP